MIPVNTVFELDAILPQLYERKSIYVNGSRLKLSKAVKLIHRFGHSCAICNRKGVQFRYCRAPGASQPFLILEFEHKIPHAPKQRAFLNVDHIIPRAKGGSDALTNKQLTCNVCNANKSCIVEYDANSVDWLDKLVYMSHMRNYLHIYCRHNKKLNCVIAHELRIWTSLNKLYPKVDLVAFQAAFDELIATEYLPDYLTYTTSLRQGKKKRDAIKLLQRYEKNTVVLNEKIV